VVGTAGRWPRKSESAKECVITHLPNYIIPKTDGVKDMFNNNNNNNILLLLLSNLTKTVSLLSKI